MSVSVHFPDGTVRNVPGQLKMIPAQDETGSFYEQVPINCDASWAFERVGEQWIARRRDQRVTAFRPPVEEWWRSIKQMVDFGDARHEANSKPSDPLPPQAHVRSAA